MAFRMKTVPMDTDISVSLAFTIGATVSDGSFQLEQFTQKHADQKHAKNGYDGKSDAFLSCLQGFIHIHAETKPDNGKLEQVFGRFLADIRIGVLENQRKCEAHEKRDGNGDERRQAKDQENEKQDFVDERIFFEHERITSLLWRNRVSDKSATGQMKFFDMIQDEAAFGLSSGNRQTVPAIPPFYENPANF